MSSSTRVHNSKGTAIGPTAGKVSTGTGSKLDYLSKYTDEKEKSKRDKKKKRKSERKADAVHILDIDDNGIPVVTTTALLKGDDDEDGDEDDEESKPVVVVLEGESGHGDSIPTSLRPTRGTWDEVPLSTTAQTPLQRRERHDSPDSNHTGDEKAKKAEQHKRTGTSTKSNRRRRHDSDEDSVQSTRSTVQPSDRTQPKRQDSDNTNNDDNPQPEGRHRSSSRRRRRRYDSSDSQGSGNRESSKQFQHDQVNSKRRSHRRRHDSDEDESRSESGHGDARTSRETKPDEEPERMASGHRAGMQSGKDFAHTEIRLQQSKRQAAQNMVDSHGVRETVHRDRVSGRVLPRGSSQNDDVAAARQAAETQKLLNTGRVQLALKEEQQREFSSIREATFARHDDNWELEQLRKQKIHADDPMAAQARKKEPSGVGVTPHHHQQQQQRPVYKGPPAKPNRYGILPGHRWDGRDRGNGFEDKLLAQRFSARHKQEQAYRNSSADM